MAVTADVGRRKPGEMTQPTAQNLRAHGGGRRRPGRRRPGPRRGCAAPRTLRLPAGHGVAGRRSRRAGAIRRRDPGLRGRLGVHRTDRTAGRPGQGGGRRGLRRGGRHLRPAARDRLRVRRGDAQVGWRRRAPPVRGARIGRPGRPGHLADLEGHAPPGQREHLGGSDPPGGLHRGAPRPVRPLPGGRRPPRAGDHRTPGHPDDGDGRCRQLRRGAGQRGHGGRAGGPGPRR